MELWSWLNSGWKVAALPNLVIWTLLSTELVMQKHACDLLVTCAHAFDLNTCVCFAHMCAILCELYCSIICVHMYSLGYGSISSEQQSVAMYSLYCYSMNYSVTSIIWTPLSTGLILAYRISEIVRITEVPTFLT